MLRRIKRTMQIGQLIAGVAGLTFGLLVDLLSGWLQSSQGSQLVPVVIAVFVVALLISIWLWWTKPERIGLAVEHVRTLRNDREKKQNAKQGLVAFVSLYNPSGDSKAQELSIPERQELAQVGQYARLDLLNSNLAPLIDAVVTHASRLEHCWLIGTTSSTSDKAGSFVYIPAIVQYLKQECGVNCEFHYEGYSIPVDDDVSVFERTLELVGQVFEEAGTDKKIAGANMVADFTGGFRSMPLGMILACLDKDRDIQMIGTHYDEYGKWTNNRFPIIFGFEPVFRPK